MIYCLKDKMPPKEVMGTGEKECWWWNQQQSRWELGSPLLIGSESIGSIYTHWAPVESMPIPEKVEPWEYDWREEYEV